MKQRASDIHIEPMKDSLRIRYRIDGILFDVAEIDKEKQEQIVGRLKSISNMHQEKQEPQDGRITMYEDYDIRSSSQKNIYGEKFVLRLLKKNTAIKGLFELGYPKDPVLLKNAFEKRNSITVIAAPTGEGKTTSLYSVISYLNRPEINITTIEDPVEIRIEGLNQIEIDTKTTFPGSLRTVLRQDPDIILVGEIRDQETAEIAMQAGQTGHYVLSTIHTLNAVEVISRLRKMDISNYDISSTMTTSISQRLVRKLCPKCRRERPFSEQEKAIINKIGERYNINYDLDNHTTYDAVGCEYCNHSGYYDRIAIFETLLFTDSIKDLIANNASTLEVRAQAYKEGYKPLLVEGIRRVTEGVTTLEELNSKLLFY
jgi:type IV pilus assembly protein PilB